MTLAKGNEDMIVNLFLINKYSRFIQRHHVLALLVISTSSVLVWTGGRVVADAADGQRFTSVFVYKRAFGKPGPVGLSRPPWLGLATCTSSGSVSRLSGHPHPSDPEGTQHRFSSDKHISKTTIWFKGPVHPNKQKTILLHIFPHFWVDLSRFSATPNNGVECTPA